MVFGKRFPKAIPGSNYPVWEEVQISKQQEIEAEAKARQENIDLMRQCLEDAKKILAEKGLLEQDSNSIDVAIALFEKRASHAVYYKEALCKELFDSKES